LADYASEAKKHETGGIVSEGIQVDPEDLRVRNGDFRNSKVSLNSSVLTFCMNITF